MITGLPRWCPTPLLLQEAGLAPLDPLLNAKSQQYGIRLILAGDDHPCKQLLLAYLKPAQPEKHQTGLQRIAGLLSLLLRDKPILENPRHHSELVLTPPDIPDQEKKLAAADFNTWARSPMRRIFLYTDGSKQQNGTAGSGWHCTTNDPEPSIQFQGSCCIGDNCEIEDAEIHAIQEGLHRLVLRGTTNATIILCADNTNVLRGLAGGRTNGREYVRSSLEDVATLRLMGCTVQGKWSPSHSGIPGNEIADTVTNQGALAPDRCLWTRTTLTWLRNALRSTLLQ